MNDFNAYRNPRLAEALRRAYGEELDVATFAPELASIIVLENDRYENRILQGIRYWSTGPITIAGAAGNFSRLQIQNPPGTTILTVVEGFVVYNPPGVQGYLVSRDGALAGTPTACLAVDTRVPVATAQRRVQTRNLIDNSLPAASGEQLDRLVSQAGVNVVFDWSDSGAGIGTPMKPIVLVPGAVCEVISALANTAMTALGYGYERPARPEELVLT